MRYVLVLFRLYHRQYTTRPQGPTTSRHEAGVRKNILYLQFIGYNTIYIFWPEIQHLVDIEYCNAIYIVVSL
jgi:hypothetical protein